MKDVLFSFKGRISRKKFWLGMLVMLIQNIAMFVALSMTFNMETNMPSTAGFVILAITMVLSIWEAMALYIKRLHDRSKSGWWVLIGLVPVIGCIWLLIDCGFLKGVEGTNHFGANPKLA
ncbi:DUF805 domain-containing protein [Enterovibrio nigricans]|uniref:Uncharacterized membrane protein YhaH, DUF805 family n=1 Tax=Enterovibrio nigricans DSM 22720 TaxID=1121868 RepID=A0A1T4UMW6_9GAMM|nr:DUF805 domain-containing protein [Enterovibrio nigricans]SKA53781.1 Uncharacterized membrane protein YhaH, DUF805 family [Enterovibrio nigricans DSM 22720]